MLIFDQNGTKFKIFVISDIRVLEFERFKKLLGRTSGEYGRDGGGRCKILEGCKLLISTLERLKEER